MSARDEIVYVIVGVHGLYIGSHFRRGAMIAQHVAEKYGGHNGFGCMSPFKMTDEHRRAWALCKKSGDRCVRATVTWWEPRK